MKRFLGLIACCLVSAVCIIGGSTINAHAVTHSPPPPTAVYRWHSIDNGLCQYDKGNTNANQMGGCNSSTRWFRSNCGNRTGGGMTLYYCEYTSQATGGCMVEGSSPNNYIGEISTCNAQAPELFSDPNGPAELVYNYWDMTNGFSNYNMSLVSFANGGLINMGAMEPYASWSLCPGTGTC